MIAIKIPWYNYVLIFSMDYVFYMLNTQTYTCSTSTRLGKCKNRICPNV